MASSWRVVRRRGSAQELHDHAVTDPIERRTVVVHEVTAPALVLGSAQDPTAIDRGAADAAGIDVARRRSGGGAVLLGDGDHVWVDLLVPAGDPLADDDIERATWWVGEAWATALGASPGSHVGIRPRGVSDREAGRIACFAAVGPGEVVLDGRKVVGISQRRTRAGARFQCVAYRLWEPDRLIALLDAGAGVGRSAGADVGAGVGARELRDAPGGARWVGGGIPVRVGDALRSAAGAVLRADWTVVSDLLPVLP